jgi:hypothetical protein
MIRIVREFDAPDDLGRDREIASALAVFDPASRDPNYWVRFRSWVMSGAARELARRRVVERLTIGDVIESWARALVPTAALVAALAGLLLLRAEPVDELPPIGVEELLVSEIEGSTIPARIANVTFALEAF